MIHGAPAFLPTAFVEPDLVLVHITSAAGGMAQACWGC
jgi:hypothetical protein